MCRDARGLGSVKQGKGVVDSDRQGQQQGHGVRGGQPTRARRLALERERPSDEDHGQGSPRQRAQPAVDGNQVEAVPPVEHARRSKQGGKCVEHARQEATPEAREDRPPCVLHGYPASSATGRASSNRAFTARRSSACSGRTRSGSAASTASASSRALSTSPT